VIRNRTPTVIWVGVALIATTPAGANVYAYHPAGSWHLGGGYDPAHPTEPYTRRCISFSSEHNIDTPQGIADAKYELYEVSTREDLYKSLNVSASLDASYALFSGSGSIDSQQQFASSADSITWIAKVSLIYGRYQPVNPTPIADIAAKSVGEITAICGTELVTQETRGVVATIVFTFSNLTTSQRDALKRSIAAHAKFTGGGVDAKGDYSEAVEKASKSSQLRITVETRGGPGRNALSSIVRADSDLAQIRAALATYIDGTTEQNIRAFSYETSSTRQFYPQVGIPQLNSGRDDALVSLYSTYTNLSQTVARIQDLTKVPVRPEDQYLKTFVSDQDRRDLGSLGRQYSAAMLKIRTQAKKCVTDDSACVPFDTSRLTRVTWPTIPEIPEMALVSSCTTPLAFTVGHQFQVGELVAFRSYEAIAIGNSVLFDHLVVTDSDGSTPVALKPIKQAQGGKDLEASKTVEALAKDIARSLGETCIERSPDRIREFGLYSGSSNVYHERDPAVSLELHDKFGRVSYLHLD
jgi:hypothetical protein